MMSNEKEKANQTASKIIGVLSSQYPNIEWPFLTISNLVDTALTEARAEQRESCAKAVPTSWLDPLLTGSDAVIGKPPWGCPDVEQLLAAIKKRIEETQ